MPETLKRLYPPVVTRETRPGVRKCESVPATSGSLVWKRVSEPDAQSVSLERDNPYGVETRHIVPLTAGGGASLKNLVFITYSRNVTLDEERLSAVEAGQEKFWSIVRLLGILSGQRVTQPGTHFGRALDCPQDWFSLPALPSPTPEGRLDTLLEVLEPRALREEAFDETTVSRLRELLAEQPSARAKLLRVVRGDERTGSGQPWAPRLRWFALD